MNIDRDLQDAFGGFAPLTAYVGGNYSNALNAGPVYANLNNPLSNSNANIAFALSRPTQHDRSGEDVLQVPLVEYRKSFQQNRASSKHWSKVP